MYRQALHKIFPTSVVLNTSEVAINRPLKEFTPVAPLSGNVRFDSVRDGVLQGVHPDVTSVCFNGCDKNFVFYNLYKEKFPNARSFFVFGNPGGPRVQYRLTGRRVVVPEDLKWYFQDTPGYFVKTPQELMDIAAIMDVCQHEVLQ